jgi:hypothetical protein
MDRSTVGDVPKHLMLSHAHYEVDCCREAEVEVEPPDF